MKGKRPHSDTTSRMRRERAEGTLWTTLGTLYRYRRLVIGVTVFAGVASVVISLLLANWYRGTARVLIPQGGESSLAAGLLGKSSRGRVCSIRRRSRRRLHALPGYSNQPFHDGSRGGYVRPYHRLRNGERRIPAGRSYWHAAGQRGVRGGYGILFPIRLRAGPGPAARRRHGQLPGAPSQRGERATLQRGSFRLSPLAGKTLPQIPGCHGLCAARRRTISGRVRRVRPDISDRKFFRAGRCAPQRRALEAEIQYEALLSQYGGDNAQVRAIQEIALASDQKYKQALAGKEQMFPVAQEEVPAVVRTYLELELETMIQRSILEVLAPLYEQARFQEDREALAVQVLDEAIPPTLKAKPKRSIICILATFSAFLLVVVYVLVYDWWARNHGHFLRRLQARIPAQ